MPRALENDRFLIISSRESGWLEGRFDPSGLSDIQPVGWMQVFNPRVVLTKLYRFFSSPKIGQSIPFIPALSDEKDKDDL